MLGHYAARPDLQGAFALNRGRVCLKNVWHGLGHPGWSYDSQDVLGHFEIDREEANCLFGPMGCDGAGTPEEAARYIEAFIRFREAGLVVQTSLSTGDMNSAIDDLDRARLGVLE